MPTQKPEHGGDTFTRPDPSDRAIDRIELEALHGKEIASLVREIVSSETRHVRELLAAIVSEGDRRYEDRYRSQQENMAVALAGVNESGRVALAATEKAIDKSEIATKEAISKAETATDKRFDALSNKVDDQSASMAAALQSIEQRLAALR